MLVRQEWIVLALLLTAPTTAAAGNVVTDWDEKAVGILQPGRCGRPKRRFALWRSFTSLCSTR